MNRKINQIKKSAYTTKILTIKSLFTTSPASISSIVKIPSTKPCIVISTVNTLAVPRVQLGVKIISSSLVIVIYSPESLKASSAVTVPVLGPLISISNPSLPLSPVISSSVPGHSTETLQINHNIGDNKRIKCI